MKNLEKRKFGDLRTIVVYLNVIFILTICFGKIEVQAASDTVSTYGDFQYYLNENGDVTICKYLGNSENITFPTMIENRQVKKIDRRQTMSGYDVFFENPSCVKSVTISEGIEIIGDYVFWTCSSLLDVTIPSTVKEIGNEAFGGTGIVSIQLPEGLEKIGDSAFSCNNLKNINIPSTVKEIGDSAFSSAGIESVQLPEGLEIIGSGAFLNCSYLKEVNIPSTVKKVGSRAFQNTYVEKDVKKRLGYVYIDGVMIDGTNIEGAFEIPEGTKGIAAEAFYKLGETTLTSVTFPNTLKYIGDSAFYNNTEITSVTLPDSVEYVGEKAFCDCTNVKSLTLSANLKYMGERSFSMFNLETLIIPEGITEIGVDAFYSCWKLTAVNLPKTLKKINDGAFTSCNSLEEIIIQDGVEYIGKGAFESDSSLNNIIIPSSVKIIDDYAFVGCDALTELKLSKGLKTIGAEAFAAEDSLAEVVIPEGVTSIGEEAFRDCASLQKITIPASVINIGKNIVYDWLEGRNNATIYGYADSFAIQYAKKNKIAYTLIDVNKPVCSVLISYDNNIVHIGESAKMKLNIEPEDAECPIVYWTSSDSSIATVDEDGMVAFLKAGAVTITAKSVDGSNISSKYEFVVQTENTVVVTIKNSQGVVVDTISVEKNTVLKEPSPSETKNGYTFLGFFNGDVKYDFSQPITNDITLTENWKISSETKNENVQTEGTANSGNISAENKGTENNDVVDNSADIKAVKQTKAKITKAKNKKGKKISLKLSGTKDGSGYQIQYGTKSNFKGAKTVKKSSSSVTISKLKKGKKYYIRVRIYKKIGNKIYYGKWSSKKTIKIKK